MVQPLVINRQELIDGKIRLHFNINKPGVFEYANEYCAYSPDNGDTWYQTSVKRELGHNNDPLFVPQGGQGFLYVFTAPSEDDLDTTGASYPDVITRLTVIERDCNTGPANGTPSYMNPSDEDTGGQPPFTGQPPITGQPPTGRGPTGGPPIAPPIQGGGPIDSQPSDPTDSSIGLPSPGTINPSGGSGPSTFPDSGPDYPGYPEGPDEHEDPPTPVPNDPSPSSTGLPPGTVQPIPGSDTPPTPDDQGPTGGVVDPRPNSPADEPTAPPGGFDPATPVPTDPAGEGGPAAPAPGATEAPTSPPVNSGLPTAPIPGSVGQPGVGELPPPMPGDPGGTSIPTSPDTPTAPFIPPPGGGAVSPPPDYPSEATVPGSDGGVISPLDFRDPLAPSKYSGNTDGIPQDPAFYGGGMIGVPAPSGTDKSFLYETDVSAWTPEKVPDMGEPGEPILNVPPGSPSGLVVEVLAAPNIIYNTSQGVIFTARVENASYGGILSEAYIILEFISTSGIAVYLGNTDAFNLPVGHYYSYSKIVPGSALWPSGIAHARAILMVHGTPVGDAVATISVMDPQTAQAN